MTGLRNQPAVPAQVDRAETLVGVRDSLVELHGALLAAIRAGFESLHGPTGTADLLQLTLHDPRFTWLRPLSGLVAEIDGLLADAEATVDEPTLAEIRRVIERGIAGTGDWGAFAGSYRLLLQDDARVVLAHAALKQQLSALPQSARNIFYAMRQALQERPS